MRFLVNKPYQAIAKCQVGEPIQDYKQALKDWHHVLQYFPDGHYADVEGFCKIVDLAEVAENDYSLTPGRCLSIDLCNKAKPLREKDLYSSK